METKRKFQPHSFEQHDFSIRAVMKGHPVIRCSRGMCMVVWWPDKKKPAGRCFGNG